jgi:hypothetical protein
MPVSASADFDCILKVQGSYFLSILINVPVSVGTAHIGAVEALQNWANWGAQSANWAAQPFWLVLTGC